MVTRYNNKYKVVQGPETREELKDLRVNKCKAKMSNKMALFMRVKCWSLHTTSVHYYVLTHTLAGSIRERHSNTLGNRSHTHVYSETYWVMVSLKYT